MPNGISHAAIEISTLQGGRAYQQDRADWYRTASHLTAAIADGCGSGDNSDRIANAAVRLAAVVGSKYGPDRLDTAIDTVADCVRAMYDDERDERDDTTLALATITPGGRVRVAWVGDSRAYVLTRKGRLHRLTRDHNLGAHLANCLTRTLLAPDTEHQGHYLQIDCEMHTPECETYMNTTDPAALVVLVTDGVCGVLTDDQISHILTTAPNARRAAKRLTGFAVRAAESQGKDPDNATALVIDLQPNAEV